MNCLSAYLILIPWNAVHIVFTALLESEVIETEYVFTNMYGKLQVLFS